MNESISDIEDLPGHTLKTILRLLFLASIIYGLYLMEPQISGLFPKQLQPHLGFIILPFIVTSVLYVISAQLSTGKCPTCKVTISSHKEIVAEGITYELFKCKQCNKEYKTAGISEE